MNAITPSIPLAFPLSTHLMLVIAPQAGRTGMLELAARLALAGPLQVLDGGNQFNVYPVARALRRQTADLAAALGRIQIARAFTCYQMSVLLAQTPSSHIPVLAAYYLCTALLWPLWVILTASMGAYFLSMATSRTVQRLVKQQKKETPPAGPTPPAG